MDNDDSKKIDAAGDGVRAVAVRERGAGGDGAAASAQPVRRVAIAGLVPQTLDDVYRLATAISKSGLAPQQIKTPEAITVAILTGLELGLPPMFAINKIAVINGRPTLWGDAIPGILWSRGFKLAERIDGDGDKRTAVCSVTRPDGLFVERSFSVAEAKAAKLWGKQGPWQQFPDRMLSMRARSFAARDGAADVLGGLYVAEEVDGGQFVDAGNSPAFQRKSSAEGKRDGSVKTFNTILTAVKTAEDSESLLEIRTKYMNADGVAWSGMPRAWADTIEEDFICRASDFGLVVDGDAS